MKNIKIQAKISFVLKSLFFSFLLSGCATSSTLTTLISATAEVAEATGHGKTAAGLTAAASASKAAEAITPENEYYIGRAVAATILTNYKVYTAAQIEQYLNKICSVITINSERPELFNGYHVKILDTAEVNAFATSGGHIFVTRGLLECTKSEDSLAAVIAHEIAHIHLQHSLMAIKTSRWTNAGVNATSAAVAVAKDSAALAKTMKDMVGDVVSDLINNGYSKSQELQADTLAVTLMNDAGYNASAMLDMLGMLKSNQNGNTSGMYKTHPSPDERIKNVNVQLSKIVLCTDTSSYRKARFSSNR
ncbi:M48 family metalloprotease [Treponema sp.]|uniref:M48 family metalloprotease n=1 Tax=Treponema sp. TaxID=166 RepID=UPI003890751A